VQAVSFSFWHSGESQTGVVASAASGASQKRQEVVAGVAIVTEML
jgi:hypothetical protein